jgi:chromosome segregation ATPase
MKDRFYHLVFIHWAYCAEKQKREKAVNRLEESRQNNLRKENCIKALTDLIQEHNNVVDAQQQEIETLLAISQQDNLGKEKYIQELHGNLEELTEELGALRQTKDLMHEVNNNALAEVKQLKEQIIRQQKDSSHLEQAVEDLTRRLLQEQKDSNDLEEAVDGLTKRLMSTEDKLAKMTGAHGALNDLLGIRSEYSENLVGSTNNTHHLLQHTRCRACDATEGARKGESQTGL